MLRRSVFAGLVGLATAIAAIAIAAVAPIARPPSAALASRLSGIQGAGVSSMSVVNLDAAQSAVVVADFFKQGGGPPVPVQRPSIAPGTAANIYLPAEAALANGAYAAIVSSDREIRSLARTDWPASGGAVLYEDSIPATDIVVVPAVKRHDGHTSLVTIQNTDTGQSATISVEFFVRGTAMPAAITTIAVQPGTSATIDVGRLSGFAAVPNGAIGHLRIRSATEVAVSAIVDVEASQKGVYAFDGVPSEWASTRLFAPVIHAAAPLDPSDAASPPLSTRIEILNTNTASPASVTVRYRGIAGTCAGQWFVDPAITLPAGDSATVRQAPGSGVLPAGCTAAATIESDGANVVATVIDEQGAGTLAAAYNAQLAEAAGTRVHVPHWRSRHTPMQLSTAVQVMNVGTEPTTATLAIQTPGGPLAGCGADCTATIPPGGAHLWWPPSSAALPANIYGSAVVEADQPLVAIVTDVSVNGAVDLASYVGIAAGSRGLPPPPLPTPMPGATAVPGATPTVSPMRGIRFVPLLLVEGGAPPPTVDTPTAPPPRPTDTPAPTDTPVGTPPATDTPIPIDTPSPTAAGGGTAIPTATAVGAPMTSTPALTATFLPPTGLPATGTPYPPTVTPAAPSGGARVSPLVRRRVPPAAINAALAHPERIAGWGRPANPNKPVGPDNPICACLTLRNPNMPYHPIFNSLVFKAYCP